MRHQAWFIAFSMVGILSNSCNLYRVANDSSLLTCIEGINPYSAKHVELILRPQQAAGHIGDTVTWELIAIAPAQEIVMAAVGVLLEWDPVELDYVDYAMPPPALWFGHGFWPDGTSTNDDLHDGESYFIALPPVTAPPTITAQGFAIATFDFKVMPGAGAYPMVSMPAQAHGSGDIVPTVINVGVIEQVSKACSEPLRREP